MKLALSIAIALLSPIAVRAITIDTVPVGDAKNPQDFQPNGLFGYVEADYRIGTTEVTNAQYVEFLNAVATSDPYNLYNSNMSFYSRGGILRSGSAPNYSYSVKPDVAGEGPGGTDYTYGDKPVVFVSWYDAVRYTNWLNNGAKNGGQTETGAYTLADGNSIARNSGAIWFLPTEDQWYKAAYYDGTAGAYYDYPTKTDIAPNNNLPSVDSGNSANYFDTDFTTHNASYPMTGAGAYSLSTSAYGTFDQGGNVWEWDETAGSTTGTRIRRGGAYDADLTTLNASHRESYSSTLESESLGFRVATIPLLPGDYNADGIVDAADYVVWRKNLNQPVLLPNKNTSGVTQSDYDVWRVHFGQTLSGSGAGSLVQNAVPEPPTIVLFVALGCFALLSRLYNTGVARIRT